MGLRGRKEQPSIVDQAVVVEGDADAVGVVAWQHLLGARSLGSVFCYKTIIPEAPSCRFRTLTRRPPSVDSGLVGEVVAAVLFFVRVPRPADPVSDVGHLALGRLPDVG